MMNPLKLSVFVLGGACALSMAPYVINQVARPTAVTATEPATSDPPAVAAQPEVESAPSLLSAAKPQLNPEPLVATPAPAVPEVTEIAQPSLSEKEVIVTASLPAPAIPAPSRPQPVVTHEPLPAPQLAGEKAAASAPAAASTPAATPKPEIPYRAEVAEAQTLLTKLGFEVGKADGKLGPKTQSVVTEFQKKHSLSTNGDISPETLTKLKQLVAEIPPPAPAAPSLAEAEKEKSEKEQPQFVVVKATPKKYEVGKVPTLNKVTEVKRIQEALVSADFYESSPDGKWGKLTIAAMKEFQEKHDLKVTGKPDTKTWKKLIEVANATEKKNASKPVVVKEKKSVEVAKVADKTETPAAKTEKPAAKKADVEVAKASSNAAESRGLLKGVVSDPEKITPAPAGVIEQAKAALEAAGSLEAERKSESSQVTVASLEPKALVVSTQSGNKESDASEDAPAPAATSNAQDSAPANAETLEISKPAEPETVKPEVKEVAKADSAPAGSVLNNIKDVQAKFDDDKIAAAMEDAIEAAEAAAASDAKVAAPVVVHEAANEDVVVRVNADAGVGAKDNLEAPKAVSALLKEEPAPAKEVIPAKEVASVAKSEEKSAAVSPDIDKITLDIPSDKLTQAPEAASSEKKRDPKLEKELEEAQASVAMLDKGAANASMEPKFVQGVNTLVQKVERDVKATSKNLGKEDDSADSEVSKAKTEALKKKAEDKVNEVEEIYKTVKSTFAEQIKKDALADRMAKIDAGYQAMREDFKKGNYGPIVERCDGFKLAIEMLADDAAKSYLETKLTKATREKLSKESLKEIDDLQEQKKYMEAVALLEESLKTKEKSKRKG